MKNIYIIVALVAALIFGSCAPIKKDDITVKGIVGVTPQSGSKFTVAMEVENKSKKDVHIEEAKISVFDGSSVLVDMILVDGVVIPKRGTNTVDMTLALKLTNPLALLGMMSVLSGDPSALESIKFAGFAKVRVGSLRKIVPIKDMPMSDALKMLESMGIDPQSLNPFKQ